MGEDKLSERQLTDLRNALGSAVNPSVNIEARTVSIAMWNQGENDPISYELLSRVSTVLGTTKINFTGAKQGQQISEMTWDTSEPAQIEAWNVVFY